jgi:hypothetical protein
MLSLTRNPDFVVARLWHSRMNDAPVEMGSFDCDGNRREYPTHCIVGRLLAQQIIDNGPGRYRPAVVELPDECTTTEAILAPLSSPASVTEHQRFRLTQLCKVDECLTVVLTRCDIGIHYVMSRAHIADIKKVRTSRSILVRKFSTRYVAILRSCPSALL